MNFIEDKYDYSSTAKALQVGDFKDIMSSNTRVNTTMGNFNVNLEKIKDEILRHETEQAFRRGAGGM